MIESIHIQNIATYGAAPEVLSDLRQFNYFYGSNGSGKTTISRIIAESSKFSECRLDWEGGTVLQPMVYNSDFVADNFDQLKELKGIFTLGKGNVDALHKIEAAKRELDKVIGDIESLTLSLQGPDGQSGKKGEVAVLNTEFKDKCWEQKKKHDQKLQGAFIGVRDEKEKFKDRILKERKSNAATLIALGDIEKKAETIFGPSPTAETLVSSIDGNALLVLEEDKILKKKVIGKTDVDIAAMIQKLGNSDWVKEGRSFYEANDGKVCPFCQQQTPDGLAKSLSDYFDEAFEQDTRAIQDLETNYKTNAERLQQQLDAITKSPSRFIDIDKLNAEKVLFDSKVALNLQKILSKKKEPSQGVALDSLANVLAVIKDVVESSNLKIAEHNKMVANLAQEKKDLTAQVWKYLVEVELTSDIKLYESKFDGLSKAIKALEQKIDDAKKDKVQKDGEIRALEQAVTSIQPTIDAINAYLNSFGFKSFSLKKSDQGNFYCLVRADGTDAKETLSEGERSFVTFLYFYCLLKGSNSTSGMTTDRVVVFDDPVSSLDSDILFIVSSMIKSLFDEVRSNVGHIKQIFVLTHNVYFHKEITFNTKRSNVAMNEETFWTVRKINEASTVKRHNDNPIKTSYELLWEEVRTDARSNLSIQNTLRRILENYFKILGGIDPAVIIAMFDGDEQKVCRSLFSWVNAGSHHAFDDLYVAIDPSAVDVYLRVFKAIFEKTKHEKHYEMMMRDNGAATAVSAHTTVGVTTP
jgi:wobble nucleotide-excising tRNase